MKIIADANIPFVAECFSSIGEVITVGGREITPDAIGDADVLLVRSITQVNADLLAGSKVRFAATATIGFDHIDIDFLERNNIGFTSAPGSNANSAAEYVIAGLLEASQKCDIKLEGQSIGIIGVGNVGSKVAKKCAALGMRIYLNDPPLQRQTGEEKYLPLKELYDCDFITFHTPLTFEGIDKTYHLAGEGFFKSLKQGCVFVNASRGGVVDSEALKTVIQSGRFKAVVLDVWENSLRQHGYRVTRPRLQVMEIVASTKTPLTPQEIYRNTLKLTDPPGIASVYRTLDMLNVLGLIQQIHQPGGCHGIWPAQEGHKHYLICKNCGHMRVIEGGEQMGAYISTIEDQTGCRVEEHWLQFFGLCEGCVS